MDINSGTKHFLSIDVGTTRFKSAIINSSGKIIVKSNHYYREDTFKKLHHHFYDREEFFEAFKLSLNKIKQYFDINSISAIGITGHGQTLIPIGEKIIPIHESIGFLDDRITLYTDFVREKIPNDIISIMYIPIALFFKKELTSIYKKTKAFLTPSDYIAFLLTEKFFISVSSPTIEPWKFEILKKFDLDTTKFPKFKYMGQIIGYTTPKTKDLFGIQKGIPVFAMGGDFAMGELGTGTISIGNAYLRFGTSGGINLCWNKNINDPRILSYKHFIDNLWNISAIINTAGITIDWIKNNLKIRHIPENIDKIGKEVLFFPYLKGEKTPLWDPKLTASIIGLKKNVNKSDILISVIIGIIMGIREGIEIIEEHGCKFSEPITASGWWSGIEWFMQMVSDITGKKYNIIQNNDAELLGIAIVLSKIFGIYPDLKTSAKSILKIKKTFIPNPNLKKYYNTLYKKYKTIRNKLYSYSSTN